jgi:hypothetical protein
MNVVHVKGKANVGDKVIYEDIVNFDGTIWEVVSLPEENVNPKWGWTKGYFLMAEDGRTHWSDLAQNGWTFAQSR